MLRGFFHGRLPTPTLTPDEFKAASDWWVSSRGYFDGHIREAARRLRHVNQQNQDEVPADFYREFEEQKRTVNELMQKEAAREQMYNKMHKFMEDMQVGSIPQAKKGPIIVGQHYGLSDFIGFQNTQGYPQGGPSMFPMQASTSFFEGAQATLSYGHNMSTPNWQTPMPSHTGIPNWQTPMSSHRATSNLQTPMPSHPRDVSLVNQNLLNREIKEARPSMYRRSPYMDLPPTTVLPKQRGAKSMNKRRNANVSLFNLGNTFVDDNVGADDVLIIDVTKEPYTPCMQFMLDPYPAYLDCHIMGYSVPELFWLELVPNLYIGGYHELADPNTEGWLSQMNAWIELLIKERPQVYMPINAGGDHWVTGAVNLLNSRFYVFDSLHSEVRRRQPYNFQVIYNDGLGCPIPQLANFKDCGVITCWLISKLCAGEPIRVNGLSQEFGDNVRTQMLHMFYNCRCKDTRNCGYD
ncbi:phospholipase-like protein [Tanacetum coccineum]